MPNGEKQENTHKKEPKPFSIPRKARKSFSIPKKARKNLNAGEGCSTKPIVHVLSQEKVENEMKEHSNTSDDSDLLDDDGWQTDSTVERMRSSDFMSLDENMIPPPLSFSDGFELDASEFLHRDSLPKASTPFSFINPTDCKSFRFSVTVESIAEVPKASSTSRSVATQHGEPLNISNVSSLKAFAEETLTPIAQDLTMKSLSPEQMAELPEISADLSIESQEQREDDFLVDSPKQSEKPPDTSEDDSIEGQEHFKDLVINFDAPESEGFKFYEGSNEHTKQSFHHDRHSRSNSPRASSINKTTNSHSRKNENEVGNSFEDMNDCSIEVFEDDPNIPNDFFNKKGKSDRNHSRIDEFMKWENEPGYSFRDTDKCDNDDNYKYIKNLPNEVNDSLPEPRTNPEKNINRIRFCSMTKRSVRFNRKIGDKKDSSIKDVASCSREVHFKEFQNISNDTPKKEGNFNRGIGINGSNRKKTPHTNTRGDISNTNKDDNLENIQRIYLDRKKVGNSSQGTDSHRIGDNFQESQSIEFDTLKKMGNVRNRIKTPFRKMHANASESSFEDINKNDNGDSFEKIQNISCEVGNSSKDTDSHGILDDFEPQNVKIDVPKKRRFFSQGLKKKSFIRIKKPPGRKRRNEKGNSSKDMNQGDSFEIVQNNRYEVGNSSKGNFNGEADFEIPLDTQINTSKKMRNSYRGVGNARKRGKGRPQKTGDSLRKSQNSSSLKVGEDLMENQNEAGNEWPHCCFKTSEAKTFRTLEPVYRDDCSIDDITLLTHDILRKNCKH